MAKTIIHVNRHLIAKNRKDGGDRPVYSVKQNKKIVYAHGIVIRGGYTKFVDPRSVKPLSCGATIYAISDFSEIELIDPVDFYDIKQKEKP